MEETQNKDLGHSMEFSDDDSLTEARKSKVSATVDSQTDREDAILEA